MIASDKTSGAELLTSAVDRVSARIVPVKKAPQKIVVLLDGSALRARRPEVTEPSPSSTRRCGPCPRAGRRAATDRR